MLITEEKQKKILVSNWNRVFGSNISVPLGDAQDSDRLFDSFLDIYNKEKHYAFSDKVVVCMKDQDGVTFYLTKNGKIFIDKATSGIRRKFSKYVKNKELVITNFELAKNITGELTENVAPRIFLRHEVLHSLYSGGKSNYLSDDTPFSGEDISAYLTENFVQELFRDDESLNFVRYSSYLLNHFESTLRMDDIVLKSKVTVSDYGRWYWSGPQRLQQDKSLRNRIIQSVTGSGDKYVSVDFISASPSMLAKLSGSKILRALVKSRIINREDAQYADAIKSILNVFVHGNMEPKKFLEILRNRVDFEYLRRIGGFNLENVLESLHNELKGYNYNVITSYKMSLKYNELRRRIVSPDSIVKDDDEIIKRHRVYLQGHIHDNVILLTWYAYRKTGVLPLYTVHDSVNFRVGKDKDYKGFINSLKSASERIKIPYRIEEY